MSEEIKVLKVTLTPIGWNGIKGITKRIPMIPLIDILHIKKRIIKSAMLIASFRQ